VEPIVYKAILLTQVQERARAGALLVADMGGPPRRRAQIRHGLPGDAGRGRGASAPL
jgi:hypothetical protein